jgi:GH43 family beta-xylosidase
MIDDFGAYFAAAYRNPVYPHSFPDPFVLKHRGEYFAYCTDFAADGNVFKVLRSRSLVDWIEIGGAMSPISANPPFYWAPEVTCANGKFYLYYSAGNETLMEIRVAVSNSPEGGFVDSGRALTSEEFAIDAHVFLDDTCRRYLFYATDFLTHTHIGTGTVVDIMKDFYTLEGNPRPVTRAKYDWQVYHLARPEKGGVRWHTVEGPFVLKRKGVYYEMFSGGNWQNLSYGVSFGVTDNIEKDEEWKQHSDGEKVLPILRTVPDLIIGPGHNSVVRGPDNRELYCVYHRWTDGDRSLAIDRMDFAGGERMFIRGATDSPQPAPFLPRVQDFFDEFDDSLWTARGTPWIVRDNQMISPAASPGELECRVSAASFHCEVSLKAPAEAAVYGVNLKSDAGELVEFFIDTQNRTAALNRSGGHITDAVSFEIPSEFDYSVFHLLRIECNGPTICVALEDTSIRHLIFGAAAQPWRVSLFSRAEGAAFSGFALSAGFEDLFEEYGGDPLSGWRPIAADAAAVINRELVLTPPDGGAAAVFKEAPTNRQFEFALNFRFLAGFNAASALRIYPAFNRGGDSPFFTIEAKDEGWVLRPDKRDGAGVVLFTAADTPDVYRQIRFLRAAGKLIVQIEADTVGVFDFAEKSNFVALEAWNSPVAFDMVRVSEF